MEFILVIILTVVIFIVSYLHVKNKVEHKDIVANVELLIAHLLKMGCYTEHTRTLLIQNYFKIFPSDDYRNIEEKDVLSFADRVIKISKEEFIDNVDYKLLVINTDFANRRDLVRVLFQLAAIKDGIKNDEWDFIQDVMLKFDFNKINIVYWNKFYSPLRAEYEDYSKYYQQEHKKEYAIVDSSLQNYLDVLGLKSGVTKRELQERYRSLALKYHPDVQTNIGSTKDCEKKMMLINEAYEKVLASL